MGWMNDILRFYEEDPIYRKYDFNLVTFSFMYVFKENYLLPFSHDEVVHGKKSMMHKMWGDRYNQFAGLRNLYTYQICHPGKKLLFMGSEYGQFLEWKSEEQLEWSNLEDPMNAKMKYFTSQAKSILQRPSLSCGKSIPAMMVLKSLMRIIEIRVSFPSSVRVRRTTC